MIKRTHCPRPSVAVQSKSTQRRRPGHAACGTTSRFPSSPVRSKAVMRVVCCNQPFTRCEWCQKACLSSKQPSVHSILATKLHNPLNFSMLHASKQWISAQTARTATVPALPGGGQCARSRALPRTHRSLDPPYSGVRSQHPPRGASLDPTILTCFPTSPFTATKLGWGAPTDF